MRNRYLKVFLLSALTWLWSTSAWAVLTIVIDEGIKKATPVVVLPFRGEAAAPHKLSRIISYDMARSGKFRALPLSQLPEIPQSLSQIHYDRWRNTGSDVLLMGEVLPNGDGSYRVKGVLVDVIRRKIMFTREYPKVKPALLRRVAHRLADEMYEAMTGVRGAFDTRIAYVVITRQGRRQTYTLYVADSDGYGEVAVLRSRQPIMSPSWSPDGRKLAYVSFENGRPEVFIQNLYTGKRIKVAGYRGINSAPDWSPSGNKLALTLSKDGSADIYIKNLLSGRLARVTKNWSIETEPVWSPNGHEIYFTSDRRGKPQIFKVTLRTGAVKRVTYKGTYNAAPALSPDGRYLAMVHAAPGKGYHIAVQDLTTDDFQILTNTFLDESPSFAPNGEMIIYAMNKDGKGQLAVVSVDGGRSQILKVRNGEVKEPEWGPYRPL